VITGLAHPNHLFFALSACTLFKQVQGGQGRQKIWSAREGATKPYRDVFTGVFLTALPALYR
jgi:hypothetical protein